MKLDEKLMLKAICLAENHFLSKAPNPSVGCVIAKNGNTIGMGFTQPTGGNHAEIEALNDAATRGEDVSGADVYVTLEPCSHFGRTPPCVDALVKAKVGRVIVALEDPNPLVSGEGVARLRSSGIIVTVESGSLSDRARELNIGFFKRIQTGRPWIRLKVATSLDGKTALYNGQSKWITSKTARIENQRWRARANAILTGIGTVKEDDPQMTVRTIKLPSQPLRIITDSNLNISPRARVLDNGNALVFSAINDAEKQDLLEKQGAEVIVLPDNEGRVDLSEMMFELGRRQINELHVEAGSRLNSSLIARNCVDELLIYLAPTILGPGYDVFNLDALKNLQDKINLRFHEIKQVGEEVRVLARFC
jgi:diaminohydroxyphosphoribosylaminopyrimidine deaminase/5-amino-6-(5-phosphoribosylamino)uracil reductase